MPCVRSASVPPADFASVPVPVRAGSSPPDSPWSTAPVLLRVPQEESVLDWYLDGYGLFCRDRERLADADEEENPADRHKWPRHLHPMNEIHYRPHFQELVAFLPLCKGFDRVFKPLHHRKGWFRRTGLPVFWVVDNVPHIFRNSWEAEAAWVAEGDPWGAILATPTFSLAVEHVQDMFVPLP
ncbi:hypothetical protein C8R45DRAFT_1115519 [Mycena sanguinolenta]|nr:hypothetical protein C8R45DRAFT_1115519 [Mycena sanguinolenta]